MDKHWMSFSPAGIWSTSTHTNVKSGAWAPLVSFRPPSTVTGGKDVARALALPSSITPLWAHLLFCPHQSYKCPTCLCPLTPVAISPRCQSSRKVTAQDTVYDTNSREASLFAPAFWNFMSLWLLPPCFLSFSLMSVFAKSCCVSQSHDFE